MENRKDSKIKCPVHWDDSIEHIYDVPIMKTGKIRPLWKCTKRQSFFWGDDEKETDGLYFMCETRRKNPDLCNEEIVGNGPMIMDPGAQIKCDQICGDCEHKIFILDA